MRKHHTYEKTHRNSDLTQVAAAEEFLIYHFTDSWVCILASNIELEVIRHRLMIILFDSVVLF